MRQKAFVDKHFIEINATSAFRSKTLSIFFRAWGHAMLRTALHAELQKLFELGSNDQLKLTILIKEIAS